MQNHEIGEWKAELRDGYYRITDDEGRDIAFLVADGDERSQVYAKLIASAPKMLEALVAIITCKSETPSNVAWARAWSAVRSAIRLVKQKDE